MCDVHPHIRQSFPCYICEEDYFYDQMEREAAERAHYEDQMQKQHDEEMEIEHRKHIELEHEKWVLKNWSERD